MALRPLSKITRLANMQVSVDPLGTKATVTIPGFSLDDIDRAGMKSWPKATDVASRCLDAAFWQMVMNCSWFHFKLRSQAREVDTMFIKARTIKFNQNIYQDPRFQNKVAKDILGPFIITHEAVHMGKTSYTWRCQILDTRDENKPVLLAEEDRLYVLVDWFTKQKSQLPSILSKEVSISLSSATRPKHYVNTIAPPGDVKLTTYKKQIPSELIDTNNHTSHQAYIDMALDVVAMVTDYGCCGDDVDTCLPIKQIAISYKGESGEGDELVLKTWREMKSTSAVSVYVDLSKDDRTIAFVELLHYRPIKSAM